MRNRNIAEYQKPDVQAKSSFGGPVGGQEYAFQHAGQ